MVFNNDNIANNIMNEINFMRTLQGKTRLLVRVLPSKIKQDQFNLFGQNCIEQAPVRQTDIYSN